MICLIGLSLTACDRGPAASQTAEESKQQSSTEVEKVFLSINRERIGKSNTSYDCQLEPEMTVLDLLLKSGVEVVHTGNGESAFIKSIDRIVGGANGEDWWIYYVNGELANQGAGVVELKAGDRVEWRLGKYGAEAGDN